MYIQTGIYNELSISVSATPADSDLEPPSYLECTVPCPSSEEEVRDALKEYAASDCWATKGSIQEMKIHEIQPKHAFRYVLQTFTETRTLEDKFEPYKNQHIDSSRYGVPPNKWSVPVTPPMAFADASIILELPHSSSVTECNKCRATGFTGCANCNGMGYKRCNLCNGSGRVEKLQLASSEESSYENCRSCSGMGKDFCGKCNMGRQRCTTCIGHMFLKHWKSINIKWTIISQTFETPRGELCKRMLKGAVKGGAILNETCPGNNPRPVSCSRDSAISDAAKTLMLNQISKQNEDNKILEFKQRVEVIPVVEVIFERKKKTGKFYIFGMERRVYFPEGYPSRCSIL